jgi:predicted nuclease with TOPRIM domain
MSDTTENAATRLWRDRVQLREQERDEAQARTRLAEGKVAALTAENDRLASENTHLRDQNDRLAVEIARFSDQNDRLAAEIARLRAQLAPEAARARTETEQQMEDLRTALLSLLDQPTGSRLH